MAEELTTRSPRVAERSLCLLPTDVTGWQRSAIYGAAIVVVVIVVVVVVVVVVVSGIAS